MRYTASPMILNHLQEIDVNQMNFYVKIAKKFIKEIPDLMKTDKITIYKILGMVIFINDRGHTLSQVLQNINEMVEEVAIRFNGAIFLARKKKNQAAKKKMEKMAKGEKKRAKENVRKRLEKEKNRKNNKFCKNETEFFLIEDIEDIPTEDLTFIKFNNAIFCLDNSSYTNMIKFAQDQKVRGNCRPAMPGVPLDCDLFFPINIGQNVFISESNYNKRYNESLTAFTRKRKFSFINKRTIDFTTGLHIVSQKTGLDDVYDLVPDNYPTINPSPKKISPEIMNDIVKKNYTVKQLKKICKDKGIKGYSKLKKAELILYCSVIDAATHKKQVQKKNKTTVKELRKICKELKIKGYSKWKKAELLEKCKRP
jgi:hypothetical protein